MKTKTKVIISVVVVLVVGLIIYGVISFINNGPTEIVNGTQTVEGIKFSDVSTTSKDGKYIFEVTLTADKEVKIESFDVKITDKKGKKIDVLSGYVGNISNGETKVVEIETEKDLSRAYKVSYTIYKE